jgi:hypothetical protein
MGSTITVFEGVKQMEKNVHNLTDNDIPKGMGIMEQIRNHNRDAEQSGELLSPPPHSNTITIFCGSEVAEKLQATLNS